MASSSFFRKGQFALTSCQLCKESIKIQWKCLKCNFLLCTKCKKQHEKDRSSDQHTIVSINDISKYEQESNLSHDLSNIPCSVHKGQNCCLFCKTCEEVVCQACIPKSHNKHEMVEMNEGYNISLDTIKSYKSEIEKDLNEQTEEVSTLESLRIGESARYKMEKQKILDRGNALKDTVDKYTKKFNDDFDHRWKELKISMEAENTKARKASDDLTSRKQKLNDTINSGNEKEVFNTLKDIKTFHQLKRKPVKTNFRLLFEPGSDTVLNNESYGIFTETNKDKTTSNRNFQVLKVYKTGFQRVENIVCCDDRSLWISQFKCNLLQKVKIKNDSLDYENVFRLEVFNMTLLPSGDLLLSRKNSSLFLLYKDTEVITETKINVAPLVTLGVHITRDKKIVLCTREAGPAFPVNGPRQVIVMSMEGQREKIYEMDSKGIRIFTVPRLLTSDKDNIYVTDLLNKDFSGRIVAVKRSSGDVKWTYQGIDIKDYHFTPSNILFTPSNNLTVSDDVNNMIHVLNPIGQCIKLLYIKDMGIEHPNSLCIDSKGNLLIGCESKNSHAANIYEVKFSGF